MPVQKTAKKKGILSLSSPSLALRYGKVKDAAVPSAQSVARTVRVEDCLSAVAHQKTATVKFLA